MHTLILNLHVNSKHTHTRRDFEFSPPKFEVPVFTKLIIELAYQYPRRGVSYDSNSQSIGPPPGLEPATF